MDKSEKKTLKTLVLAVIILFVFSPIINAGYDSKVDVKSIDQVMKGQGEIDIVVNVLNGGQTTKIGKLKVGSNSTGHKIKEIVLESGELKKYNFSGFMLNEDEDTFTITMTHLGEEVIEPVSFKVTGESMDIVNGKHFEGVLLRGTLILVGIIIVTIVGIVLISPFFKREGAQPFKGKIKFEKIIKKD